MENIDFKELSNWIKNAFAFGRVSVLIKDVVDGNIELEVYWEGVDGQYMLSFLSDVSFSIYITGYYEYDDVNDEGIFYFTVRYAWESNPDGEVIAEVEYDMKRKKWTINER